MKKILLLIAVLIGLKATAQQTYWTPGVPPSSTSFTPTFRFNGTDSLATYYINNSNRWSLVYTAEQANKLFALAGSGGSALTGGFGLNSFTYTGASAVTAKVDSTLISTIWFLNHNIGTSTYAALTLRQQRTLSAIPSQTLTRPVAGDSVGKAFGKVIHREDSLSAAVGVNTTAIATKQATLTGPGYVKQVAGSPTYITTIPNSDLTGSGQVTINGTAIALGGSGTISTGALPYQQLGTVYSKGKWTSLSDFQTSGTTPTIDANGHIIIHAGSSPYTPASGSNRLALNATNYLTELENYAIYVKERVPVASSTSFGTAIGTRPNQVILHGYAFRIGNASGTGGKALYLFTESSGVWTQTLVTNRSFAVSDSDYIAIRVERIQNTLKATAWDLTTNTAPIDTSITMLTNTAPYLPNMGAWTIFGCGTGDTELDSLSITSTDIKNAYLMLCGDSKIQLGNVTDPTKSVSYQLAKNYPGIVRNMGGGDLVSGALSKFQQIKKLAPLNILANYGTNDINNGKTPAQIMVNYRKFRDSCNLYGINLYVELQYQSFANLQPLRDSLIATFGPTGRYIDVWGSTLPAGTLDPIDLIHPTDLGHLLHYKMLQQSALFTNYATNYSQFLPFLNSVTSANTDIGVTYPSGLLSPVFTLNSGSGANQIAKRDGSGNFNATTASNLSGTPALPNGTTATTQTSGDNTTKIATDAFVSAAISAITVPTGANPTASAGTAAVNGSASTFMRSDAAPKIDSTQFATFALVSTYLPKASIVSGYVPYTGATTDVNLGTHILSTPTIYNGTTSANTVTIKNYSGGTTYVFDANGLTAGGGSSSVNGLFKTFATYTNSASAVDYNSNMQIVNTSAATSSRYLGFSGGPVIAAANNQNITNANGIGGGSFGVTAAVGATGTLTYGFGVNSSIGNLASGFTMTTADIFKANGITATGPITNAAAFHTIPMTTATNQLYFGVYATGAQPTGNWLLYGGTAYNAYGGTGNWLFNTTTDNSSGKVQVNGLMSVKQMSTATPGTDSLIVHRNGTNGQLGVISPSYYATDANVMHLTGNEIASGNKTFIGSVSAIMAASTLYQGNTGFGGTADSIRFSGSARMVEKAVIAGNGITLTQTASTFTIASSNVSGQTTLVAGTKAISITGVTTSSKVFLTLVSIGGTVSTTWQYAGVCTSGTLTITALTNANTADTTDTSIINYQVIL